MSRSTFTIVPTKASRAKLQRECKKRGLEPCSGKGVTYDSLLALIAADDIRQEKEQEFADFAVSTEQENLEKEDFDHLPDEASEKDDDYLLSLQKMSFQELQRECKRRNLSPCGGKGVTKARLLSLLAAASAKPTTMGVTEGGFLTEKELYALSYLEFEAMRNMRLWKKTGAYEDNPRVRTVLSDWFRLHTRLKPGAPLHNKSRLYAEVKPPEIIPAHEWTADDISEYVVVTSTDDYVALYDAGVPKSAINLYHHAWYAGAEPERGMPDTSPWHVVPTRLLYVETTEVPSPWLPEYRAKGIDDIVETIGLSGTTLIELANSYGVLPNIAVGLSLTGNSESGNRPGDVIVFDPSDVERIDLFEKEEGIILYE